MNCTNHENVEASGMCTYCGKPFCKDCLVEVKGKMYCKNDLDKVFDEKESKNAAAAMPQINITNTSSNVNTNQNVNGGLPSLICISQAPSRFTPYIYRRIPCGI